MESAALTAWDEDEDGSFEVVEELTFEEVVDEGFRSTSPIANDFTRLVAMLEDVARANGATGAAMRVLRGLMGLERLEAVEVDGPVIAALTTGGLAFQSESGVSLSEGFRCEVLAWRGVLLGQSEDMSGCGRLGFDEWCANVLARALGVPAGADGIRRDLRRRGVAAFGLAEQAA